MKQLTNGKNYDNAVFFGYPDQADSREGVAERFDTLTEARAYAARYSNAHVVRYYYAHGDSGDYMYCKDF